MDSQTNRACSAEADEAFSLYNVKLDKFEGPLDLLLYLIRKNELDIYDIPISIITRQYLEYLKLMKELNLEVAGDFLVMASTLIQIKSSTLLPSREDDPAEEEAEDPRAELIRRLVEYSRYKEAASLLNERKLLGRELFARTFPAPELQVVESTDDPLELELFELIEAFRNILAKAPRESFHEVSAESISIAERINEILSLLQEKELIVFEELFENGLDREYIVATFLAILELCKLKLIRVRQQAQYATLWIMPAVVESPDARLTEENGDGVTT
ncbi:MAG: segregation/condensation protein A [Deltaproteobacteria bacterium]|nr:segregation/condensation protein A [Deltaproteobacteria bacterium]